MNNLLRLLGVCLGTTAQARRKLKTKTLLACLLGFALFGNGTGHKTSAAEPQVADVAETKYLTFQLMTGIHGYSGPHPLPGHFALSKAQLEEFVHDVVKAIGTTGDARRKLGFAVGPLCFDMPDDETRQFIRDAFAVARENDVAVAFHIDDSMSWGNRKDLLANPDNIETADWKQIPNTGRRADWGRKPTKFPPQMCFNSPAIVAAVKDRAGLIGAEIKQELAALKSQGKEHLFAGVIAGWETQMGRDLDTDRQLGYRALSHRGFSESNPPKDLDAERVKVVKEFMELWANSLHAGGTPREKVFCHIAFTDQGLRKADAKESYAVKVHFALPEVAFSSAYRPGFSTYPEGATFKEIHAALGKHGSPGWISGEGTNVSPTSMPGEPTMETYLGRTFNHGGVLVNVFSWGIGGEAHRNNFFRKATENPECLAAYAKFLRGETLVEAVAQGFSASGLQDKMHKIQAELPGWMEKSGLIQRLRAMWHMRNLQSYMKERKWQELDKEADEVLALIKSAPVETKTEPSTATERLPAKIQKIQSALPTWIEGDAARKDKATALMQQLHEHLKAKNFAEAEKTADELLALMSSVTQSNSSTSSTAGAQDEKVRKHQSESGEPAIITRDYIQDELKLSDDQKQKLQKTSPGFEKILDSHDNGKIWAFLEEALNAEQFKRFEQLELQHEGPSALFRPRIEQELKITGEQRNQFMGLVQAMTKEVQPLINESKSTGNPGKMEEIRLTVIKLRTDCLGKLTALMSDAQKKQWSEMLGKPFDTLRHH
ncbi:MAG: hypothetical protein NT105_07915 [Verrucomicrobia bacterium]|nr:hypothetical protein [Verrucomicrobiota bacterium]